MTTLTVGSGQQYATITAAVAAASPGDTIDVQAGTYTNDFPGLINGLTIEGVGGIAKLVATAQPGNGKAILDVEGNTTLKNLDISGVTVPDGNGAAIRYESGNLLIQNTAIHGNQDGILGAADPTGTITIDGSEIYANGTASGSTHNIYIGDIATFTLTNSYVHDANTGHEIKSRAENNVITNDRIEDNASTASYEIDLPNGGNATISGDTIQKSANSGNHVMIAYGEEGSLHAGTTVSITNDVFVSDQSGADAVWDVPGTAIATSGDTAYGLAALDKAGYVTSGFTTLSTRPTLDTSSPIKTSTTTATTTTTTTTTTTAADTTAPTLTVSQSVSGTTTSTGTTLSGTVADSGSGVAAVEIYENTAGQSTDIGAATLSGGNWSYAVSNLAPGTYTFYAVAFDRAGNSTAPIQTGPSETVAAPVAIGTVSAASGVLTFKGTATPGSTVTLVDTPAGGAAKTVAAVTAASDGTWSISTQSLSTGVVNTLSASAAGLGTVGAFILASKASDTMAGTAGRADVFAFAGVSGRDVVQGFETTAAAGSVHDVIDLAGTSYSSFAQLKSAISGTAAAVIRFSSTASITLTGINASTLSASDFRFS